MKKQELEDFDGKVGLDNPKKWNKEELNAFDSRVKENASGRSPQQRIKNQLAGFQYSLEEKLDQPDTFIDLEEIVKELIDILNITKKELAKSIDMDSPNLSKYLKGERKFNPDLAMRLGSFFHIKPEIWLEISMRNELLSLKIQKTKSEKYTKYDYEKVITF
ncbi:transcriptional regulator [Aquiflexum sp.]|uniref:helix-turn-helix transcriptional regulator n=1 Tax=Aquiflexum sp. TaxID=1872584 RepID=UPI0035935484